VAWSTRRTTADLTAHLTHGELPLPEHLTAATAKQRWLLAQRFAARDAGRAFSGLHVSRAIGPFGHSPGPGHRMALHDATGWTKFCRRLHRRITVETDKHRRN